MTTTEEHLALVGLLSAYTAAVDTKDWPTWQGLFTDRIVWILNQPVPGRHSKRRPVISPSACGGFFAHFTATHHSATSHRVTVDGDEARIQAHIRAEHWVAPELVAPRGNCWLVTGFYDDRAVRTADGWRLSRVRLEVVYEDGAHVWTAAAELRDRATSTG